MADRPGGEAAPRLEVMTEGTPSCSAVATLDVRRGRRCDALGAGRGGRLFAISLRRLTKLQTLAAMLTVDVVCAANVRGPFETRKACSAPFQGFLASPRSALTWRGPGPGSPIQGFLASPRSAGETQPQQMVAFATTRILGCGYLGIYRAACIRALATSANGQTHSCCAELHIRTRCGAGTR
jgi:hypothetical protein